MKEDTIKILQTSKILGLISKISIYSLVALIPIFFLPWTMDVLDFNKQALLVLLVFVAFFAWMLKILVSSRASFSFNLVYIPMGAVLLTWLLSTVFSLWRYGSFWGWPLLVNESFLTILCLLLLFFLIINIFERKDILKVAIVLISSWLLSAILGIFQILGKFILPFDFAKTTSFYTVGSANSLAVLSAVMLPLLILLIISARKSLKIFSIVSAVVGIVFIILVNFTVAWWIVMFGSALAIIFGTQRRDSFDVRWLILPMFFLAIALLSGFFKVQIFNASSRPIEVSLTQKASLGITKNVVKDNVFLGSGPGTFIYDFSKYKNTQLNQSNFWNVRFEAAGSKIINTAASLGVLGTLAVLLFMGVLVFYGIKFIFKKGSSSKVKIRIRSVDVSEEPIAEKQETMTDDSLGIGIFISFLAMAFGYFFHASNLTLDFVYFLLAAAFLSFVVSGRRDFVLKPSSVNALVVTFSFTLIFIFSLGLLILGGQRYVAQTNYLKGVQAWQEQKVDDSLKYLEGAASLNPNMDLYWRELSQAYLQKVNTEAARKDLPEDQVNKNVQLFINNAVNSAKKATNLNPNNVANWSILGFVYQNLIGTGIEGLIDLAIDAYDKAIELEPNNPYYPNQKGMAFVTQANFLPKEKAQEKDKILESAEQQFNASIALKSDYSLARFQLAMIYKVQGRQDEAARELEQAKKLSPSDVGLAFQLGLVYFQEKDYNNAKNELERAIALNPDYSNALFYLALTYDELGQKQKAIEKIEKVIFLNPNSTDIKMILDNLKAGKKALEGISTSGQTPQPPVEEAPLEKIPDETPPNKPK